MGLVAQYPKSTARAALRRDLRRLRNPSPRSPDDSTAILVVHSMIATETRKWQTAKVGVTFAAVKAETARDTGRQLRSQIGSKARLAHVVLS